MEASGSRGRRASRLAGPRRCAAASMYSSGSGRGGASVASLFTTFKSAAVCGGAYHRAMAQMREPIAHLKPLLSNKIDCIF